MAPTAPYVKDERRKKKAGIKKPKVLVNAVKSKIDTHVRIKCPICFENINKVPTSVTRCGHVFCTMCLKRALRILSVCPTCRTRLRGASGHHALYLDMNICDEVDIPSEVKTGKESVIVPANKVT